MSNRLFQGVVHQMRDTIDRVVGVIDETATTIACSDLTKIGERNEYLLIDFWRFGGHLCAGRLYL